MKWEIFKKCLNFRETNQKSYQKSIHYTKLKQKSKKKESKELYYRRRTTYIVKIADLCEIEIDTERTIEKASFF